MKDQKNNPWVKLEVKSLDDVSRHTLILPLFQDAQQKVSWSKQWLNFLGKTPVSFQNTHFAAQRGRVDWGWNVRDGGVQQAQKKGSQVLKGILQILFVGLGPVHSEPLFQSPEPSDSEWNPWHIAGAKVYGALKERGIQQAVLFLDFLVDSLEDPEQGCLQAKALIEGILCKAYQFDKYKTHLINKNIPIKIILTSSKTHWMSRMKSLVKEVELIGPAMKLTRDWSNEPSNEGTPEFYASESKKIAAQYGLVYRCLGEKEAAKEKMSLFLGVSQGSVRKGRIVQLEYRPKTIKGAKTIVLIGKGVTFDSGGISIKPSLKMEQMKHDMTGAATVMGATLLAALWGSKNRIITYMPFVENMPDGGALQPGNIVRSRSGKTVEIINTDAEGRLILADLLDYVQEDRHDVVIDVATLTGAVGVALGKQCCAILGNDRRLVDDLSRAGHLHSERLWPLPLYEEYLQDLKSDCADLKNSSNDAYAGTIRGAVFLKQFIQPKTRWAHLDIAAMAYDVSTIPFFPPQGASGAYVRTLAQFIVDF